MRRISILAFVVVALVAVALLGGCSNGYSDKPEMKITATALEPAALVVKPGTDVTFANVDDNLHAISCDDLGLSTPQINQHKSASLNFATAGTYHVYDRYHPAVSGTITVK